LYRIAVCQRGNGVGPDFAAALRPTVEAERQQLQRTSLSRRGSPILPDQDRGELQKLQQDEAKLAAAGADSKPNAELQLSVAYQHRKLASIVTYTALTVANSATDPSNAVLGARQLTVVR
jgi:hypothetical protein